MSDQPFQLPVDIPQKSEIVKKRAALMVMLSLFGVAAFLMFLLSVGVGGGLARSAMSLPDLNSLENWAPNQSTRIFDRDGALVANIHGDEDRVVVPLSDISPNLQRAVLAIEDTRFYEHNGVDVRGTFRAFFQNLRGGEIQGGSTVTQQLVKNLFLSPERSIGRKVAEAVLAVRVEKRYPKEKILEMYLNQVYWGNQAYGAEKAARRYFRKPASDLSIAQSALLAGLLKAPEGLSPFAHPHEARVRQMEVLGKMAEQGYITDAQKDKALQEEIVLNSRQVKVSNYPYFVTFVIEQLMQEYGEDVVRRGGLKVYTTLDAKAQEAAEKALTSQIKGLAAYTHVTQGALVAIDVPTAEIIALVGGVDFEKNQFNSATMARRAPGSQFKPFVYLTGFRLGAITPETPISDRPVCYPSGAGRWCPHNWDGKYMGSMNIRRALTLSRNTPTVQIGMKVGIDEVIKTVQLSGIDAPIDPNSSSFLGSSGISPLEMATGFSTFARGGKRIRPTAIRRVEDIRGRKIALKRDEPEQVFDAQPVAQLVSILVDAVEKGTGVNARLPGRQVAGKTGTTDKVRDVWFTGFTPDLVATVWMGNPKYIPLKGVFSSNAAKVWHDFSAKYYEEHPIIATKFLEPSGSKGVTASTMVLDFSPEKDPLMAPNPNNVPLPPPGDNYPTNPNPPVVTTTPVKQPGETPDYLKKYTEPTGSPQQ